MKIGDKAEISHCLSSKELSELSRLSGLQTSAQAAGALIAALWSTLLGCHLPGPGTLYLRQQTRHLAPAPIGEPLTASVEITGLRPERYIAELVTRCVGPGGDVISEGLAVVYCRHIASAA